MLKTTFSWYAIIKNAIFNLSKNPIIMLKKWTIALGLMMSVFIAEAQKNKIALPQGLKVGDVAPEINTKDYLGNTVKLSKLLKKGPVVLMFYRGNWCPYCNTQLKQLQDSLELITSHGGTVIAITPESVERIGETVEKTNADFRIIQDKSFCLMKAYDVGFELNKDVIARYRSTGINIKKSASANSEFLPVPATYIIGQDQKIVYGFFDPDYTKRATVAKILKNL